MTTGAVTTASRSQELLLARTLAAQVNRVSAIRLSRCRCGHEHIRHARRTRQCLVRRCPCVRLQVT
jgi:hypothetical protein